MKPELDDELRALARALRETKRGEAAQPDGTRTALLRAQGDQGKPRGVWLAAAAVLFTLVSVPSAWAFYSGYLAPEARSAAPHAPPLEPQRTALSQPVEGAPETIEAPVEVQVVPASVEPMPAAPEPSHEARSPRAMPRNDVILQHDIAVDPTERRVYERAHALHFDAHDAAGALAAWDAYLTDYPAGRFAPEAQYNRALSLVRLGDREEAREALAPFARGAFGTYRAREAQALLDALSEAP